jgi:N-acyl-D-aspartate/D-glutamate deacylase
LEEDLRSVLHHGAAAIGSDGLALDPDGPTGAGRPHPRSYGCYPKLLGRVVREDRTLSLERAVQMATSIPASRAGLSDRGMIREGAFADMIVFDPARVIDCATFEEPAQFPKGIQHVIVNGVPIVTDGEQVDVARPGRVLTRGGRA